MGFPQFANIDSRIYKTMVNRAVNNKGMSELQPWIRVTSTFSFNISTKLTFL